MSEEIKELSPKILWRNFYKLTQIPRPSHHEEQARKFLLDWAAEHDIAARMDAAGNIIMQKPATHGMEKCIPVILQAHLDMVPQKNGTSTHNFLTDPIDARIDGEEVRANGTTLGADNGIGVAAAMSVLESNDLPHGPIEVLITATEETGMEGAFGLKSGELQGKTLLNLDSETISELYVGCAGGEDLHIEFDYQSEPVAEGVGYRIELNGLRGGHSGMDIHLGRGNSNQLMARFLRIIGMECNVRLVSLDGGDLKNAIPREASAVVVVENSKETRFKELVAEYQRIFSAEYAAVAPDLSLTAQIIEKPARVMTAPLQQHLVNAVIACPHGALRMIDALPDTVETSNNLAIVRTDADKIYILNHLRSSVATAKTALEQRIRAVFELAQASRIYTTNEYPGWSPNPASPILKHLQDVHRNIFRQEARVMAVHAGLECGILGATYPEWDMISFGPSIFSPHSPGEHVNIASVEKFWAYLRKILETMPK